jgi:adenine-specific DNA methylase
MLWRSESQNHEQINTNAARPHFHGFPGTTLLEAGAIPIADIADLAIREGQHTNPLYRVHRWFARRLGSQFRSIVTGLSLEVHEADRFWDTFLGEVPLDGAIVLDPFVGGGTSLVEAMRCGAYVIGYDIDPVATFITRFELEAATYDPDNEELAEICASVASQLTPFHRTTIDSQGEYEVLHHFWVECRTCCFCGTTFEIHPHFQLAFSEEKGLQWVFCKNCHEVYELPIERREIRCTCGVRTRIAQGTLDHGKVRCPACNKVSDLADRGSDPTPPTWRLFAQEYIERTPSGVKRHFKKATKGDVIRYREASHLLKEIEDAKGSFAPMRQIPTDGRLDQRPLIHGIRKYRDLFNDRQLLHLTVLGKAITAAEDPRVRSILNIAFSEHLTTNCMYTAYAFGYRRVSPMFSIHSYRHITRPVEINPWLDGIGRGTFPNTLSKIAKAVAFAKTPTELDPNGGRIPSKAGSHVYMSETSANPWQTLNGSSRASICTKTSEFLTEIADATVDLILTDPPYFDNVSYSELSDFYLAWHQSLGLAEPPYNDPYLSAPIGENLALTSRTDEAIETYQERLLRILSECQRVLKRDGIFVFTYHHKDAAAWNAVGEALARSGFKCTAVLPLRGEGQGGLHSYDGTIKWDAVFVCRKETDGHNGETDSVIVSHSAIESAKRCANMYAEELGKKKSIGFREPDRLNLERALIAASAFLGEANTGLVALHMALYRTREQGES